jgi:hypothetical protein
MADHTVTISASFFTDPDAGTQYSLSINSPATITVGQTVKFIYANTGQGSGTVRITGLNAFSDNSTITLSKGASKTLTSNTIMSDTFSASINYNATKTANINVQSNVDSTPDTIVFGGKGNLNPGSTVESDSKQVTGINTAVSMSVSNGQFKINSGGYSSATRNVSPNQTVTLRGTASSNYNTNTFITGSIGGNPYRFTMGTKSDPNEGEKIPFPITSLPINLKALGDFFGRTHAVHTKLSEYIKGQAFIPNISENSNIPTSMPLRLSNYVGSFTTLYWVKTPSTKFALVDSVTTPSGTLELHWKSALEGSNDFDVGYNTLMRNNVDYRYTVVMEQGSITSKSPTSNNFGNEQGVILYKNFSRNQAEEWVKGELFISARHKQYPGVVINTSAKFEFLIYQ